MSLPRALLLATALLTAWSANAQTPEPPTAAETGLPDIDPAAYFTGKQGGTFGGPTAEIFPRNPRVLVTGFRVIFVNHSEATARVRGSYLPGRDKGDASSKTTVHLVGVDNATLQKITDAAFDRFVAQLRAAGREVLTHKELPDLFAEFKGGPAGLELSEGSSKGKAFTPTGMPTWFAPTDYWTPSRFDQTNALADAKASLQHNAISLSPHIVVDFAQMLSSGNRSGLVANTASTGASLSMGVRQLSGMAVRAEEVRSYGVHKGDAGGISLKQRIDTDLAFADLQKVEEKKGGFAGLFGALGSNANKAVLEANTSNEAYSKAAETLLERVTGALAKWVGAPAK